MISCLIEVIWKTEALLKNKWIWNLTAMWITLPFKGQSLWNIIENKVKISGECISVDDMMLIALLLQQNSKSWKKIIIVGYFFIWISWEVIPICLSIYLQNILHFCMSVWVNTVIWDNIFTPPHQIIKNSTKIRKFFKSFAVTCENIKFKIRIGWMLLEHNFL